MRACVAVVRHAAHHHVPASPAVHARTGWLACVAGWGPLVSASRASANRQCACSKQELDEIQRWGTYICGVLESMKAQFEAVTRASEAGNLQVCWPSSPAAVLSLPLVPRRLFPSFSTLFPCGTISPALGIRAAICIFVPPADIFCGARAFVRRLPLATRPAAPDSPQATTQHTKGRKVVMSVETRPAVASRSEQSRGIVCSRVRTQSQLLACAGRRR